MFELFFFLFVVYGVLNFLSFSGGLLFGPCFEAVMAGLPGCMSRTVGFRSRDSCLYEKTAMTIAKAIGFNVDNIAGLELPGRFRDKIFEIICKRGITDDDVLIRVGRNGSEKRKIGALREELRRKFARISAGDEVLLETVFD